MGILFTNNASSTLASGITNVATTLTVAAGQGALFPAITSTADYFYCTIVGTSKEIVKVTARSTDTFTIARAQEGTTAVSHAINTLIELRITAQGLTDLIQPSIDAANYLLYKQGVL